MFDLLFGFPTHGSCAASHPDFAASAFAKAASSEKKAENSAPKRVIHILSCMQETLLRQIDGA